MGASAGIMMAASSAGQGISGMGNAYAQSTAMRAQGNYKRQVGDINANLSNLQAEDAIQRGNSAADRNDTKTRQLIGAQKTSMAAQGVDVASGSAADIQASAATLGALDSMTIRNNATREAYGYKMQGVNDTYNGQFADLGAENDANNTLLTGGMNAVSSGLRAGYYWKKG